MEIRAALAPHFVGFNTGRWDYINSVADAMAWDPAFVNPNIDAITMTYGYMRDYEDRVRRAVNTPDRNGRFALWQGGMEPNIPVGSAAGVAAGMAPRRGRRASASSARGPGASGWRTGRWSTSCARCGRRRARRTSWDGRSRRSAYEPEDADGLVLLEPAPRTIRGARDLLSVALQYGNAFGQGFQAAALKPADFFGDDDVLYLMEDMATGEIRCQHPLGVAAQGRRAHRRRPRDRSPHRRPLHPALFARLLDEEYGKLLAARDRDVHDDSKATTLPIAREIVATYVPATSSLPGTSTC